MSTGPGKNSGITIIATNRQARHRYALGEEYECGIVLRGSEVKSLREGKVQITESFADIHNGEMWLYNLHIPTWLTSQRHNGHETVRPRKLLMHRREIDRLTIERQTQRIQLIPTLLYFRDSFVKVEISVGKPLKVHDRRQDIAKRDSDREARRELVQRSR